MARHEPLTRFVPALALVAALFASAGMTACSSSANVDARSTTVGQELKDLDEARNKGLLTEDEYNKKRQDILKRK